MGGSLIARRFVISMSKSRVYTSRINVKTKHTDLNITRGSGEGYGLKFAPTWSIIRKLKKNEITKDEYKARYLSQLRVSYSYVENESAWEYLLSLDDVVLKCYCSPQSFCHRYILADVLSSSFGFKYLSEIR